MGDIVQIGVGPRRGMRRANSARAWYQRGCALEARDPTAAEHAYRRAIAGLPSLADAHNNLGRLLHDRATSARSLGDTEAGELAAAEACYRRALAIAPGVALYHFNLGVALEDSGRADDAIASYAQAIELDASFADAHFNLARQLERAARSRGDDFALHRAVRHLARYRALVRRHHPIFK